MSLATRLQQLRLKKGQSLQEVADAISVSKTHVWEIEKGRSKNPSVDLLEKLADHYDVTVASLVGEDLQAGDEQLMRMFRQAGKLNARERAVLDGVLKTLLDQQKSDDDNH